ncbi:Sas10/Utp3/C1D family-domain-containing protein [Chaetomidium leptoderma]|uniref:Sas10/Utp3/C1D family-domain-containing protein n=1 Tax=Chaetomidium leptoderma TaxID=669021 RepID=A0AAN6VSW8_9PEZI|nr:Sas10/Utp3/C1D family-domain-containing protein [Chaetomidium leptoderma]
MAAPATLPALLDSLTKSLTSTFEATPKLAGAELPKDGISLLDVKNELLLSYLQNLVFLILLKLRQAKNSDSVTEAKEQNLDNLVVSKLVELRLYLEKGARPLEDKLRFQIDKVLRAADDAERNARAAEEAAKGNESGSESGSEEGESDEEEDGQDDAMKGRKIADLQHRPNLAGFQRPAATTDAETEKNTSGVYRPPKIAPVAMPTTERREKVDRRKIKSATLDEFIADEMSTAPIAEPSIGTTIMNFGRKIKTSSERRKEDERRDYEEGNFVRLPNESKKDRAKKAKQEGRSSRMNFGGEEWRDLKEGVDRISRLTQGRSSGGGTKALLEKSRKRGIDTTDGPRGSGANMGERYQKRLKVLDGGRGTRGKGR